MLLILATIQFIAVHGSDGQTFYVNPTQITSMREPVGPDIQHFPKNTHCVIVTTSGKFVAVQETCAQVRDTIGSR